MKSRMVMAVSVAALFAAALPLRAVSTRVVGVLAGVERPVPMTLQVTSRGAEMKTVRTDARTAYVKWITHKPWQASASLDTSALVQGRCVEVETNTESGIAKVVRVSDEPAGSVFDPCRERR